MHVDGHHVTVLELSTVRALIISDSVLKPDQRVRVVLRADGETLRIAARVAAAQFEMPKEGPRYRGELTFEGDTSALGELLRSRP
jgi:hypothetical protein